MLLRRAADLMAVSHMGVIGFLLSGGFVARRYPRITTAHLATLAATAAVYAAGQDCPLTTWEKGLRQMAGDEVYGGGYLEHYLVSPVHPAGMNAGIGLAFVGVVVASTALAYGGRRELRERCVRVDDDLT